jgi:hypothetical protein
VTLTCIPIHGPGVDTGAVWYPLDSSETDDPVLMLPKSRCFRDARSLNEDEPAQVVGYVVCHENAKLEYAGLHNVSYAR